MTKDDLINLGYSPASSSAIIRQAKAYMVNLGFEYYNNRRLGRVPSSAICAILGIGLEQLCSSSTNTSTSSSITTG
ncbi:DUF3173 domain-containing protein [Culicoidibacter larvae]|uniref:DUF3173 domain-containing protein n=1 Tax=Culicoidibacter larvae TaxID=2579976 RepID=A0A5R8QAS5_9FIRM|nr:DUF3173 domain-containing protein [Culicoidibacter larvae]